MQRGIKMSKIIKEQEKIVEQDIVEQAEVEKKLRKASEDKTIVEDKKLAEKKKGQKVAFIPARRVPKIDAPEGFVASWKHNTPENVRRLQLEGWQVANRMEHKMDLDMGDYYRKMNDKPVSEQESTIIHNEMICMVLPEDMAEARREYYKNQTEQMTRAKLIPENDPTQAALAKFGSIKTKIEIN